MKSFRSYLNALLFKGHIPKTFVATRLPAECVKEHVVLTDGSDSLDITAGHAIVCHSPFCVAAQIPKGNLQLLRSSRLKIQVKTGVSLAAEVAVSKSDELNVEGTIIVVFKALNAKCFQLGALRQFILFKRYFLRKKKDTYLQGKLYAALYSYPRQVIAVSYLDDEYFNIFPMDFQCAIPERNLHIFGLRTTNITLEKILKSRKVLVADTDAATLETIYTLGRNHSATPPALTELPFEVSESERYHFPVPAFSASYKEIEIVWNAQLGTHMMMIGKIINVVPLKKGGNSLYHIHFFEFVNSGYESLTA